jgi:hypothetical protein
MLFDWITKYAGALALIGTAVWTVWQYATGKRAETKKHQFEAFHNLVKQLVEGDGPNVPSRIDRQIAVIFELRHFPRYYPVTRRILTGLQTSWAQQAPGFDRLHAEIAIALQHINAYPQWWAPWRRID